MLWEDETFKICVYGLLEYFPLFTSDPKFRKVVRPRASLPRGRIHMSKGGKQKLPARYFPCWYLQVSNPSRSLCWISWRKKRSGFASEGKKYFPWGKWEMSVHPALFSLWVAWGCDHTFPAHQRLKYPRVEWKHQSPESEGLRTKAVGASTEPSGGGWRKGPPQGLEATWGLCTSLAGGREPRGRGAPGMNEVEFLTLWKGRLQVKINSRKQRNVIFLHISWRTKIYSQNNWIWPLKSTERKIYRLLLLKKGSDPFHQQLIFFRKNPVVLTVGNHT